MAEPSRCAELSLNEPARQFTIETESNRLGSTRLTYERKMSRHAPNPVKSRKQWKDTVNMMKQTCTLEASILSKYFSKNSWLGSANSCYVNDSARLPLISPCLCLLQIIVWLNFLAWLCSAQTSIQYPVVVSSIQIGESFWKIGPKDGTISRPALFHSILMSNTYCTRYLSELNWFVCDPSRAEPNQMSPTIW